MNVLDENPSHLGLSDQIYSLRLLPTFSRSVHIDNVYQFALSMWCLLLSRPLVVDLRLVDGSRDRAVDGFVHVLLFLEVLLLLLFLQQLIVKPFAL